MTDLLAYARQLEEEDAALGRRIATVEELRREAADLRGRGAHAVAFLAERPRALEARAATLAEAEAELERRNAAVRETEAELRRAERAEKEEAVLAARRAVVRARDLATSAQQRVSRARAELEALEAEARAVEAELPELDRRAQALAARLADLSRVAHAGSPEPGPAAVEAWAARAEAASFVARSGLETERERVVRQANELAASALGEPLAASSVSVVRERLERRG